MKFVVFGLTDQLVLGQRPRHALARALPRRSRARATGSSSSSATCPITPTTAIFRACRGGELVLYRDWEDVRGRARARTRATPTSRSSRPIARTASPRPSCVLDAPRALAVFYDLDTPVTLARLARGENACLHRPATGLRDFDLVLSYTGGAALDALRDAARRAARRAALRPCRSRTCIARAEPQPHYGADLSYLGTYAADRQAALEELFVEPARLRPERALPDRRRAISAGFSVDATTSTSSAICRRPSTRRSSPRRG